MAQAEELERLRAALADRYEVQRAVGAGGMATVYVARDPRHDRMVAIKVLRPELAASIGTERFLREIKVAAQLQHPNILALYDSGEAGAQLFYVMPFVEGESLRDRLNRDKQLPIEEAVMLTREAADALHFAHQRGIVHRDIKPENLMLLGGHVLVADFGIARALTEAGAEKLTQTGMAIGTPHYMSPEQAQGEAVDGRSDVYSLACTLYELLVGQPPFDGPNPMAILARHSLEAVPAMRVVRRTIPEDLEEVVNQALEKSPADRFQSAAEFSQALAGVDLSAVPHRVPTTRATTARLARRRKRNRMMVLLGTGSAVVGLGVVALFAFRGGNGGRPQAAETGPAASRIAVLYFEVRGGTDSLGYVADGLTEALIQNLSGVSGLTVISRNGVRPYRDADVVPDSIGRALNVGTLVSGTLAQSGERLRLDISLVNARTGAEIANRRLERPRGEIFALQDTLASEIAYFLRESLGREIQLRQVRGSTRNGRAWELVQQAEAAARDAESLLADDVEAARRQLARADSLLAGVEEQDRRWVVPSVRRGWLAYRECRMARNFDTPAQDRCTTRGLEFARRALELDPNDPDALELRATHRYWRWLNNVDPDAAKAAQIFAEAEAGFRASVTANPQQASAWTSLAHLLFNKPDLAEAKLAAGKAYQYDPYLANANATVWRLFQASLDLEEQVEAVRWCDEGARRFPADYRFVECRLWLYALPSVQPDVRAAWAHYDQYVERLPPNELEFRRRKGQMLVTFVLIRAGLADSARRVAERARVEDASIDPRHELYYYETLMRTMLGDREEAFRLYRRYLASNPQRARNLDQEATWWTRDLRADPRWESLKAYSQ